MAKRFCFLQPNTHRFGGGVDPWIYHHVAGIRPQHSRFIEFGVEGTIMQRVRGASAETKLDGNVVRSAWNYNHAAASLQ